MDDKQRRQLAKLARKVGHIAEGQRDLLKPILDAHREQLGRQPLPNSYNFTPEQRQAGLEDGAIKEAYLMFLLCKNMADCSRRLASYTHGARSSTKQSTAL